MIESTTVRDAMLEFFAGIAANDADSFDRLVADDPALLVIGTSPGEWITDRMRLRKGFETDGYRIVPGPAPRAWEGGELGWFVDEPTFDFPDGVHLSARLTTILARTGSGWRLLHMHASVGVPDDEVEGLQARWAR